MINEMSNVKWNQSTQLRHVRLPHQSITVCFLACTLMYVDTNRTAVSIYIDVVVVERMREKKDKHTILQRNKMGVTQMNSQVYTAAAERRIRAEQSKAKWSGVGVGVAGERQPKFADIPSIDSIVYYQSRYHLQHLYLYLTFETNGLYSIK